MAETLTVAIGDGNTYAVTVTGVDLFTTDELSTPVTFPQDVSSTTSWYAAELDVPGRRPPITITAIPDGQPPLAPVSTRSLPVIVDVPEMALSYALQGIQGEPGVVQSVVAGTGATVDASDPANPIVGVELPLPSPTSGDAAKVVAVNSSEDGYQLDTLPEVDHGIPVGGTTAQVLTKASNDDYDADWEDVPAPADLPAPTTGDAGKVLTVKGTEDGFELDTPSGGSVAVDRTADITLTDGQSLIVVDYYSGSIILDGDAVLAVI